jgi:hypothetical protein
VASFTLALLALSTTIASLNGVKEESLVTFASTTPLGQDVGRTRLGLGSKLLLRLTASRKRLWAEQNAVACGLPLNDKCRK